MGWVGMVKHESNGCFCAESSSPKSLALPQGEAACWRRSEDDDDDDDFGLLTAVV